MSTARPVKQRWGIITVVLVVDLGLAAAGVVMLREGLRDATVVPVAPSSSSAKVDASAMQKAATTDPPPPNVEPIAKTTDAKTDPKTADTKTDAKTADVKTADAKTDAKIDAKTADATTTAPSPPDPARPGSGAAAGSTASGTTAAAGGSNGSTTGARGAQHRADATKATRKKDVKTGGPLDPYDEPPLDIVAQVDQLMAKARPAVDGCYAEAAKAVPADRVPHGIVKIAFRVLPDGHLEHASAVDNTTSSEQLAACLVREVAGWSMPTHPGDAVDFVRAFSF